MKPKPYAALRGALVEQGIEHAYLAVKLGRCLSYVDKRINARGGVSWTQDDMYKAMELLDLPYEHLHIYFPPDYQKRKRRAKAA